MEEEGSRKPSNETNSEELLSKQALKRLKRKEQWQQSKVQKKQKKKEEKAEKKARCAVDDPEEVSTEPDREQYLLERREIKQRRLDEFASLCMNNFHVIIDCDWEKDHSESSLKSLIQQVMFCYGHNKRHEKPVHIHLSGLGPLTIQQLEKLNYSSWKGVSFSSDDYLSNSIYSRKDYETEEEPKSPIKKELVYLTAEGEELLETLSPSEAYVIGGIVDRNRLKGITYEKAKRQKIRTARLPIKENITLASSHVLTVNHVFEILLTQQSTNDWKATLEKVIPKRKEKDKGKEECKNSKDTDSASLEVDDEEE
jgi:tRNA (guanine9-N1)-methyltransferase